MTQSIYETTNSGDTVTKWLTTHAKVAMLLLALFGVQPARAANDLLVAPTRLEFDSRKRSAEVILSNIGQKAATYRVSLVVRRMTAEGKLEDVETPNEAEQRMLDMLSYAPRRIHLEPNQPQSIRVAVRKPADLADGEYRVHMMFRAVPDANPVVAAADAPTEGFAIQLIPIYGITIPVFVRQGALSAEATMSNARIDVEDGHEVIAVDLARTGNRSTYGEIRVLKSGVEQPVTRAKGIAVYTEVASRTVHLPLDAAHKESIRGPATIQYFELDGDQARLVSEIKTNLN